LLIRAAETTFPEQVDSIVLHRCATERQIGEITQREQVRSHDGLPLIAFPDHGTANAPRDLARHLRSRSLRLLRLHRDQDPRRGITVLVTCDRDPHL
jgi:hypothetical protein